MRETGLWLRTLRYFGLARDPDPPLRAWHEIVAVPVLIAAAVGAGALLADSFWARSLVSLAVGLAGIALLTAAGVLKKPKQRGPSKR